MAKITLKFSVFTLTACLSIMSFAFECPQSIDCSGTQPICSLPGGWKKDKFTRAESDKPEITLTFTGAESNLSTHHSVCYYYHYGEREGRYSAMSILTDTYIVAPYRGSKWRQASTIWYHCYSPIYKTLPVNSAIAKNCPFK